MANLDKLAALTGRTVGDRGNLLVASKTKGRLGKDLTTKEGYQAARECAVEILRAVWNTHGTLDNLRVVNLDNELIRAHLETHPQFQGVHTYGMHNDAAEFFLSEQSPTKTGTRLIMKTPDGEHGFTTTLFGSSHLSNLVGAIAMSLLLKVPIETIERAVKTVKAPAHRLERKQVGAATLLDNAFSSNEEGFRQVMKDLTKVTGKKALLTPGVIELGTESAEIHRQLGQQAADIFEMIYLVGDNERTQAFSQGVKTVKDLPIEILPNETNLWPLIDVLAKEYDWILLENDLPDNYS